MQRNIDRLTETPLDLVILGGGITGAGVALEATLRGWRVALIDKGDFASGTSSVSSKLVHGGLRYLEQGHFHLVYEALHDRGWLLDHAPHLVWPLRFLLPYYQGSHVPSWKWRLGLTIYDLLAGSGNIRRSRPLTLTTIGRQVPQLQRGRLQGGAEFSDAQMDDARLCIEVLRTAWAQGAALANYVAAIGFDQGLGGFQTVRGRDQISGREIVIAARLALNATGPWVDQVCRLAGEEGGPHLQPTKGVHLIAPERGLSSAFLLLHPDDGRVFFVIPWLGKTLIGTTDTITPAGPDELSVTPEDVAYLLKGFNAYLMPPLETAEILGSFAGLRPLISARAGEPSDLSREYRLWRGSTGLWSVAGGKYTTFRTMARHIVDEMACKEGKAVRKHQPWRLDSTPDEPWPSYLERVTSELTHDWGLATPSACHLVRRYGRRVLDVVAYLEKQREGANPLYPGEPDLAVEIAYQRDHEMALFPADHFLRRTRLGLFRPELLTQCKDNAA